jgi:hypothetical protein
MPGAIGISNVGRFLDCPVPRTHRYLISGVTRDSVGNALGNCAVKVFETVSNLCRGATISDASGNYQIEIAGDRGITFRVDAYLAGSPDVSGTSVNTLTAS